MNIKEISFVVAAIVLVIGIAVFSKYVSEKESAEIDILYSLNIPETDEKSVAEMVSFVRGLGPYADRTSFRNARLHEIQYLCWCKKVIAGNSKEEIRELVLVAHWTQAGTDRYTFVFLNKILNDPNPIRSTWRLAGRGIPFVKATETLDTAPSTNQLVGFITNTDFGNREFHKNITVERVVPLIEEPKLVAAFEFKLDSKAKRSKRELLMLSNGYR